MKFAYLCFFLFLSKFAISNTITIDVVTYPEQYKVTKEALFDNDCQLGEEIPDKSNYLIAEAAIFCQALRLGGITPTFILTSEPSQARVLRGLEQGHYFSAIYTFWGSDFNERYLLKTMNLVERGEFTKGIYTLPSNKKLLEIKNISELNDFTAVSNRLWVKDWKILECLTSNVIDTKNHINMVKMLEANRVDFILQRIKQVNNSFETQLFDVPVTPVPNIKVSFDDSLSFFISKKYKNSEKIYDALSAGLKILKDNGTIRKLYAKSGFYDDTLTSWTQYTCVNGQLKQVEKESKSEP